MAVSFILHNRWVMYMCTLKGLFNVFSETTGTRIGKEKKKILKGSKLCKFVLNEFCSYCALQVSCPVERVNRQWLSST